MTIPSTISDLSSTASLNSPSGAENVSTTDDYLRAVQGIVKTVYVAQQTSNSTFITAGANSSITSLTGLTTPLSVAQGGTGANSNTATAYALKGANSDISSLSGLTTPLSIAQGGTGATTHAANSVLLGNGTTALLEVAPSTSGNVLTSNGTTWQSVAPPSTSSMTLISSGSLPAATSLTLSSIPQTYRNLVLVLKQASGAAGTTLIQPNSDATVLDYQGYTVNTGALAALATASIALDGGSTSAKDHYCTINNYADTGTTKQCISSATNGNVNTTYFTNCIWASLTAISSLKVTRSAAWTGGTYGLWGVK